MPGSTQLETGQRSVAAFEAELVTAAADGAGMALPESTQVETGQGVAAASDAGLVNAAAEGAGTAARTS